RSRAARSRGCARARAPRRRRRAPRPRSAERRPPCEARLSAAAAGPPSRAVREHDACLPRAARGRPREQSLSTPALNQGVKRYTSCATSCCDVARRAGSAPEAALAGPQAAAAALRVRATATVVVAVAARLEVRLRRRIGREATRREAITT